MEHLSGPRKSELHHMPIWDLKELFPMLPDDPKNILLALVTDNYRVRIGKLRNEMNRRTRKAVLGEVKYEDRQAGKQIFAICDLHDKDEKCDLGKVDPTSPRAKAERTTATFMELTAHCCVGLPPCPGAICPNEFIPP